MSYPHGGAVELPLSHAAWKNSGDYSNRDATAGRFLYGRTTGAACEQQRHSEAVGASEWSCTAGGNGAVLKQGAGGKEWSVSDAAAGQ